MSAHGTKVYHTLESYLASMVTNGWEDDGKSGAAWTHRINRMRVRMIRRWNEWKLKHPSEPLVERCEICSGKEREIDIKLGKWKISTREEQKQLKKEISE